jgi:hypothetical protein
LIKGDFDGITVLFILLQFDVRIDVTAASSIQIIDVLHNQHLASTFNLLQQLLRTRHLVVSQEDG